MGSARATGEVREDPRLMTDVTWQESVRRVRSRPIVEAASIPGYAPVFNLSDGRVPLIHRVHPAMHLAVFDDLDHFWDAGPDCLDAHMDDLEVHIIIRPTDGALGVPVVHAS
jgi:hypothetical protein